MGIWKSKSKKYKEKLKKILEFLFNPRLLLCIGAAWLITNGWSYVFFVIGTYLGNGWMVTTASAYLAFLWLPVSPEKLVTFAIAIWLLRRFFPDDTKTLAVLQRLRQKTHEAFLNRKQRKVRQKQETKEEKRERPG